MTIRDFYARIIRWHPLRFRQQFETEMLATFDQAAGERHAFSLLLDAFISLVRQWVLRPNNWKLNRSSPIPAGGGLMLLEQLRLQSEELHRRAWRVNLVVLAACLLVIFILPSPRSSRSAVGNAIVLILFAVVSYHRHRKGLATVAQEIQATSIASDPRRMELVRRRDSLQLFSGGGSLSWPWMDGGPVVLFFFLMVVSLLLPVAQWRLTGTPPWNAHPVRLGLGVAGAGIAVAFWHFSRKLSRLAAAAIQQEIDAMDRPHKP